jgi:hypothetical protein
MSVLTFRASNSGFYRLCAVASAVIAITAEGCDNNNPLASARFYPVKGKVLLPDGKPLTSGHVVFADSKTMITSTATIESDGSYVFKGSSGDGLPVGDYKIRIEAGSSTDGKKATKGSKNLPFSEQFLDEDTSGLSRTVTDDATKNDFELKLNPTKSEKGAAGDGRSGR